MPHPKNPDSNTIALDDKAELSLNPQDVNWRKRSGAVELNNMKCVAQICVSHGRTIATTGVGASHRHLLRYFLKKSRN